MTNKNKKATLLNDNSDLKISKQDMALDYDALAGIISAKRDYKEAEKNKDYVSMTKANQKAEAIRRNFGYEGGLNGAGYYKIKKTSDYTSKYQDEIDKLYQNILTKEEFTYDAEKDPIYQAYKKIYTEAGEDAYDRALAQNSFRTGGIANTSAISAATQAQAHYNAKLSELIPKLYTDAYDKYTDSIKAEYDKIDMLKEADKTDYDRYLKSLNEYYTDREYYANQDNIELERAYQKMRDEASEKMWQADYDFKVAKDARDTLQRQAELDYQKERDAIKDEQWLKTYNLNASKKKSSSSGSSNTAIKNAQWEKEYKLDAIKAAVDIAKTMYDTGIEFEEDIIGELLKSVSD